MDIKLMLGDCLEVMPAIPDNSVDLVVTSPPYDNLRTYNGSLEWSFDIFQKIALELKRVLKDGGTIVWVVGDTTYKGSETGTSFRQALYFKEIGLNLHDTMIYAKQNYVPLTHNRYEQEFEYMFVISKGRPKSFNPIKIPCKYAGQENWGAPSFYKSDDGILTPKPKSKISANKIKGNIFYYRVGSTQTGALKHPAPFPLQLAADNVLSWSNPGDVVLDPFLGSGTTGVACVSTSRKFIGIEKEPKYFEIAQKRVEETVKKIEHLIEHTVKLRPSGRRYKVSEL